MMEKEKAWDLVLPIVNIETNLNFFLQLLNFVVQVKSSKTVNVPHPPLKYNIQNYHKAKAYCTLHANKITEN